MSFELILLSFTVELMTIATRKFLLTILTVTLLSLGLARTGSPLNNPCTVTSPKRFQKLHSYPVDVVVQFNQEARPETFKASLNGMDITSKFEETEHGARALVGLMDGLRTEVRTDPRQNINILRTSVRGLEPDQDVDFETFFFVEVDQLVAVGSEGGAIQSLDGRLLVEIPPHALSSTKIIALTRVRSFGSGHIGATYELAPKRINLNQPVAVAMQYDTTSLPPGVMEGDLFLLSGQEFPRRLENLSIDETAHTVGGTMTGFSKVFMSYYRRIGKRLNDIPPATDFRLPIGDYSDASYACGKDYEPPSENDLGETLGLLRRSSYPNFDYPNIVFNENKPGNTWNVITAFNQSRYVNSTSGPTEDSHSFYGENEGMFSNGEDWSLASQGNDRESLPIRAITDGLVIYNGRGYGNTIVLAHRISDGLVLSVYSHMSEKSRCAVGTLVHKGNVVGKLRSIGTTPAYLHCEIAKESLIKADAKTGEIKVPAIWFGEWRQDSIYENYYDPTNFLLNGTGKYTWDFNVNGNDEGWTAKNVKRYQNGYRYQVRDGVLSFQPASGHFQIVSYPLKLASESFDSVFIRMRSNTVDGHGKVYFSTDAAPQYSEDKAVEFEMLNDGKFHEYRVFMADSDEWKGAIVGIRIDLLDAVIGKTTMIDFDNIRAGRAYLSQTPDTGQTKCYDNSQEIICPAPDGPFYGQDAQYAINPPSYEVKTINGQEVVIDHVTGLTWQRDDDGIKRTWQEAIEYCDGLTLGAYSDWRLPTKKELQGIASYGGFGPALDTAYFPYSHLPDDCYWSATTRGFLALSAWKVCLWNNQVSMLAKSDSNYVRAVRGRPLEFGHFKDDGDGTVTDITTGLMWQQREAKAMTWEKALAYCESLDVAGYSDWRLPNIRELLSLVDDSLRDPSIDTDYFPGCRPSIYWSSTTHSLYVGFAWHIGFDDGRVRGGGHKGRRYYLRAVRAGH